MANIKYLIYTAAALSLGAATPSHAQQELQLEAGQIWTHAHSGIDVPASIGDLSRTRGVQIVANQLDVAVSFANSATRDVVTVYIFRNTSGAIPVWFAQSQGPIENSTGAGTPSLAIAPRAFTPPRQSVTTGLQAVYGLTGGNFASTGVALFPIGDWYVKIRATSGSRTPAQNAAWMTSLVSALRLPPSAGEPAAAPIAACRTPLAAQASQNSPVKSGAGVSRPSDRMAASQWCRDAKVGAGNRNLYRPVGTTDRYLLATGDNGNAMTVRSEGGYYSVNFVAADETHALPPQDKLPLPADAIRMAEQGKSIARFATWPTR